MFLKRWVEVRGEGNTVQRCRFSDKAPPPEDDSGVLVTLWIDEDSHGGYNTRILNNQFLRYNEGQDHLGNGFETIRVGTHGKWDVPTKVLIEGNYFYRMDAEAEVISIKTSFNTIRNNAFEEVRGAMTFRHGQNNILDNNVFFGAGVSSTRGVRIFDENHVISNNWFSELTSSAILVYAGTEGDHGDGKHYRAGNITITGNTIEECHDAAGIDLGSGYTIPPVAPMLLAGNRASNTNGKMIELHFDEYADIYDFSQV